MQTFKKLFAFMLIASAMAPALAMDRKENTATQSSAGKKWQKAVESAGRGVAQLRGIRDRLFGAGVQPAVNPVSVVNNNVEKMSAPLGEMLAALDAVEPVVAQKVSVAEEVAPLVVVVEEAAPARIALSASNDEALVIARPVAVNRISGLRPALVAVFPSLARIKFFSDIHTNAAIHQDPLVLRREVAPLLQIAGGEEVMAPVAAPAQAGALVAVAASEVVSAPAGALVEVLEGQPSEIVAQQSVEAGSARNQKRAAVHSLSRVDAVIALAVERFPSLERLPLIGKYLVGRTHAPAKANSRVVPQAIAPAPELEILGGEDAVEFMVDLEVPAVALVVEEEAVDPVSTALPESDDESLAEEGQAAPARIQDIVEPVVQDEEFTAEDFQNIFGEDQAAQEPLVDQEVRADAAEAEAARLAEVARVAAEVEAARVAAAAEAARLAAATPSIFARARTFAGEKADGVKDFYKWNSEKPSTSIKRYGVTAALAAAIAGGSYALYNYLFADEASDEEVTDKAPAEAPVKTTVAVAPVAKSATPKASNNGGARNNGHACRKHRKAALVRAKCRGKKSCNKSCK